MATKLDLKIDQGTSFKMAVTITDENGTKLDLTGYVFTGHVRKTVGAAAVEFSFAFTVPTQVGDDLGKVLITVAPAVTSALNLAPQDSTTKRLVRFVYDIESDNGGEITRWFEGEVIMSPEVTR